MTNALETLIQLNRKYILHSKFQNTIYKNQKLCEFLGEKTNSEKPGDKLTTLIIQMIDKLPGISYKNAIKYRDVYEKYPHLYIRFRGWHNYLVNVQEFLDHIDKYKYVEEIPVTFYPPSFFSQAYKIVFLNKITGVERIKHFPLRDQYWGRYKAQEILLHLFYNRRSYQEILENTSWCEYESLIKKLKAVGGEKALY